MYIHNKLSCPLHIYFCSWCSITTKHQRWNVRQWLFFAYDVQGQNIRPASRRARWTSNCSRGSCESYLRRESHQTLRRVEYRSQSRAQRSHFVKPKVDQTVSEYIECCRLMNPSIYGSEIRQRLLLDGVVHPVDVPSVSQINRVSHTQHAMTRKRITAVPRESTTPSATEAVDAFLKEISNFRASKLHFFDESSVVKTTGNRKYGSAVLGEPAIEVQRYASNLNYTINLLHSINGVDFFNILDGPSNGMALLKFFDEALQLEREDGSATLERGDCVIMDNRQVQKSDRINSDRQSGSDQLGSPRIMKKT